jgi:hypothetical protein
MTGGTSVYRAVVADPAALSEFWLEHVNLNRKGSDRAFTQGLPGRHSPGKNKNPHAAEIRVSLLLEDDQFLRRVTCAWRFALSGSAVLTTLSQDPVTLFDD